MSATISSTSTASAEPVRAHFVLRALLLTVGSGIFGLAVSSAPVATSLRQAIDSGFPGLAAGEVDYLVFIVHTLLLGLGLILLLLLVIGTERPRNLRAFFKLGPFDWPGLGLLFLFLAILNAAEGLVLRPFLYEPTRLILASIGFPLTAVAPSLNPDPHLVAINLGLLVLVVWVEAPEEIFFRGYLQNHLQQRIGSTGALLVSAIIWDAWHLFDPAGFVRRFLFGLALGLVFRVRQNTTPLAIGHAIANRLLLAGYIALPLLRGG